MTNLFSEIEEQVIFNEEIMFDESKIKEFILNYITNKLIIKLEKERPFYFEQIISEFFIYRGIKLEKNKKTRDFGLDGMVKLDLEIFGDINLGLQIKYKLIDSNDIDLFLTALRNAELQLGVLVCKDSRQLQKYELNSKIKAILFSRGIQTKERLLNNKIDINPVLILKLDDLIEIAASEMRAFVRGVYKK